MSYGHRYRLDPELDSDAFVKVADDFRKMVETLKQMGVIFIEDNPRISPTEIRFNGAIDCGHEEREIPYAYPEANATGIFVKESGQQLQTTVNKSTANTFISSRVCDGSCLGGEFRLETKSTAISERYVSKCYRGCSIETGFKPYDLAVIVCLIIAKKHLRWAIRIESDGTEANWNDGMQLCQKVLGYGKDFTL